MSAIKNYRDETNAFIRQSFRLAVSLKLVDKDRFIEYGKFVETKDRLTIVKHITGRIPFNLEGNNDSVLGSKKNEFTNKT